ncbi:MAG: hypothetical protein ACRC7O_00910, partial [Fimbriiglobus sp.]
KGPVTFFVPNFWAKPTVTKPELAGQFLDTRPSDPNRAVQMETQHIPAYTAVDSQGITYARVAPTRFPSNPDGTSPLIHKITSYNKSAMWDGVKEWFAGGPAVPGKIDPKTATIHKFRNSGGSTWQIYPPFIKKDDKKKDDKQKDEKVAVLWNSFATPDATDPSTYGYTWAKDTVTKSDGLATLPEYYRLDLNARGKDKHHWSVVSAADVPAETGLAKVEFSRKKAANMKPYVTPDEPASSWKKPGPAAGPFEAKLGDGSTATYYWYRFADQPALLNADLTAEDREKLQKRVEMLHKTWTKDREYFAPPTVGALADLDPAVLVMPPQGLEIGYVPIVTRQGLKE